MPAVVRTGISVGIGSASGFPAFRQSAAVRVRVCVRGLGRVCSACVFVRVPGVRIGSASRVWRFGPLRAMAINPPLGDGT